MNGEVRMNTQAIKSIRWYLFYVLLVPAFALAQPISLSPDITMELAGEIVTDENVAIDDQTGGVVPADIGTLPDGADLTAYHVLPTGDQLMAFDTSLMPGSVTVQSGDVVRFDGSDYTLEFDASEEGVPAGATVDALTSDGTDLLLSFNTTVMLSGATFDDADLVQVTQTGFVLYFDSALAGVPAAMDLDAADVDTDGVVYVSFDTGGNLGNVDFADEDMLSYDPGTGEWTLAYDGDALHANWAAADLDALALVGDSDGDGIPDTDDNCTLHDNPDQRDTDGDGYGNLCDGDLNNDGNTNTLDLNLYKQAHRTSLGDANYNPDADFNGDGAINTLDLNIYKGLHRKPPGPSCCAP
jgi:hypothetical protein